MDGGLKPFGLTSPTTALPDNLPVYDIFFCRDRYIGMVAPYYTRSAFGEVAVRIEGQECPLRMLPDARQFTASILAEIPGRARSHAAWDVQVTQGRRPIYHCRVDRVCWQGRLAMATLAKFDWPYIKEWVDYHAALGVERFYIYNNNEPRIREALLDHPLVTHIDWPYPYGMHAASWEPFWPANSHHYTQLPQQMHAILKYGDCWDWIGMFDVDEFIVPMDGEHLPDMLDKGAAGAWCELPHVHCAAVELRGKWFGTSGHDGIQVPVLPNYTQCEQGHTASTKWFVRPQYIDGAVVHYFETAGQPAQIPTNVLRYNHYRAISDHHLRRKPSDHGHYSNETLDKKILER